VTVRAAPAAIAAFLASQLAGTAAAYVDPAPTAAPQQKSKNHDLICQKIVVTGSRLASHQYCATREQWAQSQLQDRQEVERVQASPCVLTRVGAGGKAAC
jgi:hypothetical protein